MRIQTIAFLLIVLAATSNAELPGIFDKLNGMIRGNSGLSIITKILKLAGKTITTLTRKGKAKTETGKPEFCSTYECPSFTVKNKTAAYELRCYNGAMWVSAKDEGSLTPMTGSSRKMFQRLLKYISGENKMSIKMNMTVPVLIAMEDSYKIGNYKLKMSFYIPEEFQKDPPKPTNNEVFLEEKEFCAYVRSFGGYKLFYSQYLRQAKMLKKDLAKDGLQDTYVKGIFYYAGYNKPWKLLKRHNEVMLLKE